MTDQPALFDGPLSELPLSAAVEEMTGFETIAVETHFRTQFNDLGGVKTLLGCVWVYANRNGKTASWNAVKSLTLKQMNGLFAPEPEDADSEEPDTDQGKGF